jgi:unsaturated rhamnogalacturonyl hydrolase
MGRAVLVGCAALCGFLSWSSPARAAIKFFQAEDATVFQGVREISASTSYTGASYVNPGNQVGSSIQWTITTAISTLKFRYANGNSKSKSMAMKLRIDGELVANVSFSGTGGWSTWRMAAVNTNRPFAAHVIELSSATSNGGPNIDRLDVDDGTTAMTDWTYILVESTMARFRAPSSLGSWTYFRALFLRGVLLLHERIGDPRYLAYVQGWVDSHVNGGGAIDTPLDKLDNFMPGHLLLSLLESASLSDADRTRYTTAAATIRARFDTYPRLRNERAYWHKEITPYEIWADGVFMANPFLLRYGLAFPSSWTYAQDEATAQVTIYASHLQSSVNGLLRHGWDEDRNAAWADRNTGLSPEFWCRAMGWFGMTIIDSLDMLPADHPKNPELIAILQKLIAGLVTYQDPATGRWFQVVDKGSVNGNWLETSCGSMHTYVISKAIEKGYVTSDYAAARDKGYAGTLAKISLGSDGLTNLTQISEGTAVGDLKYYLGRAQVTNDMHGLGAFIIMFEQLNK